MVNEIQDTGAEIKDFEKGIVDFPAIHQRRRIHYCWCPEDGSSVKYWHKVDEGSVGRKKISEL